MTRTQQSPLPLSSTFDYVGSVEKVRTKTERKLLILTGDVELEVHRSSCVGLEDQLRVTKRSGRLRVDAICENGIATVLTISSFSSNVGRHKKRFRDSIKINHLQSPAPQKPPRSRQTNCDSPSATPKLLRRVIRCVPGGPIFAPALQFPEIKAPRDFQKDGNFLSTSHNGEHGGF